jgi:cation transport regulator ChaC
VAVFVEEKPVETEHEQQQDEQSVPEIPVIRSNTPRPISFDGLVAQHVKNGWQQSTAQVTDEMLSAFPQEAPLAPPVPEEVEEAGDDVQSAQIEVLSEATPVPLPPTMVNADASAQEFVWLFEYGLEMDNAMLNSPDRLHNLALLYGPAVLKGYQLVFAVVEALQQKVVATVAPLAISGAEVWGIVYRIPRRLLEQENGESSELDRVHSAVPPASVYERLEVVVSEAYRGRELPCITYIARQNHHSLHIQQQQASQVSDTAYLQRLLAVARKQTLPDEYIQALALSIVSNATTNRTPSPTPEQNTEPLPVLTNRQEQQDSSPPASSAEPIQSIQTVQTTQPSQPMSRSRSRNVGLVLFACYLGVLLLLALALAVMQGLGILDTIFTVSFTPLNVPWYVLLYGLIGGNLSCLVMLGRRYGQASTDLPDFVITVWCLRPFVGIILAMLVYLLFNAGLFVPLGNAQQHMMLFSLLATVAGFGERLLFTKQIT